MKKTKTKCYLYTRVSTSMQVDGYSLDAQRDKLRKYAEYEDMVVAGEYSDEGFSGKNIQGRHEFQRMLQDIQDCKDGVEYVLVFKLSRFGRNAADVLNSLQLMQDFGVNLICVEDGIDSSKDSGKLMISVLSAVAEIERENIRTQTMAGREQKAREGKWNGGFAPYGYRLEKGELLIAEDEVDVIRTIFDRYIHTNDGVSGVAKYLNRQGFVKKLRQNGTIPGFSASFVKSIIDNPVYMGKIAYGRRRTEKKIGTRNEMHVVEQSEFPVYEGKHEAIISEEDWNLAQEKRKINAYRREKVNDPTHAHILSGILKCPCCGKSLYGNIAKAHSKDKKTRYYYYCKNTVTPTGHECTFRLNIEQMEMNRMVASIISAMVSDPRFADAIKAKIGSAVDTNDLEKQLEALQAQLRQTLGTKARLERQMDGLDVNDPYYDRKISDLQRRYDEQYGAIDEIEVQIDDVQSQIRSIRQEKISGDNIYRLLLAFDQVYEAASEVERKEFMRAFIERIELFPEKQPDGNWIRKIIFNFPVPVNGTEVKELPLENETIVETDNPLSPKVAEKESVATMTEFLSKLSMKVWNGTELIYDASPDQLDGLKSNKLLGTFRTGETVTLKVELSVPIELDNKYANRVGEVDWIFHVEAYNESQLSVRKVWSDGNANHANDSITVNLLKDGKVESSQELNAANGWAYTFDRLLEGHTWTVEEAEVPAGYTVSYNTVGTMTTITNTRNYTPPDLPDPTYPLNISVRKVWSGDDGKDRPDSVTVTLYNGDVAYETVRLGTWNNWTYTWKDLSAHGNWQVVETNIPKGYVPSYRVNNGVVTITNTRSLIQTGQLNWSIWVLGGAGLVLVSLGGAMLVKKKRKNNA